MTISKIKNLLVKISVICIIVAALIGISLVLFKLNIFGDYIMQVLITLLILGVGSLLSLNSVGLLEEKTNVLAIIALVLLATSSLVATVECWVGFKWDTFTKILLSVSIFSVLFNFIVSYIIKLGSQRFYYQLATYIGIGIFNIFIIIEIFSPSFLSNEAIIKIFVIDIILTLVGMAILSIFSKKSVQAENHKYIKITKDEYETLKFKAAEYDKMNLKPQGDVDENTVVE